MGADTVAGTSTLRLAVCETAPELRPGDAGWDRLAAAVRAAAPDVLLLPEMPFGPWLAGSRRVDGAEATTCCRLHEEGIGRLSELGTGVVLGSRPVVRPDGLVNEAFVWTAGAGRPEGGPPRAGGASGGGSLSEPPVHTKQRFPEEEGYWEARWFRAGPERFGVAEPPTASGGLAVGFLICTDVWFGELARGYRDRAELIAVPRATPPESLERWRTAVRMAALVSGCYGASSNRAGVDARGQAFGGVGWIVSPDGDLLAETSPDQPVAVAPLDPAWVRRARKTYPRYVR